MELLDALKQWKPSTPGDTYPLSEKEVRYLIDVLDTPDDRLAAFVAEWKSIWPPKEELETHGVTRTIMETNVDAKLKAFVKDFKKHTGLVVPLQKKLDYIAAATMKYLKPFKISDRREDWQYIKSAGNFISHREKGSELGALVKEAHVALQKMEEPRNNNHPDFQFV